MEAHFGGAIPVEFELITRGLESELNQACKVILVVAGEVKESWGASRLGGILVAPIAPCGQVHVMGLSHHSAPVEVTRFSM